MSGDRVKEDREEGRNKKFNPSRVDQMMPDSSYGDPDVSDCV